MHWYSSLSLLAEVPDTKSQPAAKPQPVAKPQPAAKLQPTANSKPTATSKPRQTTHGLGCMDPRTTFLWPPDPVGVGVPSLNKQNNLPWVGLHLPTELPSDHDWGSPPLHLDLLPDRVRSETWSDQTQPHYIRSETWSDLTQPCLIGGILWQLFYKVFPEMHFLGCREPWTSFVGPPTPGSGVPSPNINADLPGWVLISLPSFSPDSLQKPPLHLHHPLDTWVRS